MLTFTRINLDKNVVYVILINPVKKGWRVNENVSGMCMFVKRCLKVTKIRETNYFKLFNKNILNLKFTLLIML